MSDQTSITLVQPDSALDFRRSVGQTFNEAAAKAAFDKYRSGKAENTLKAQDSDLQVFAEYLKAASPDYPCGDFAHDPAAWAEMTWGIVEGFVQWQLIKGYAVGTVNRRLSTVKKYVKLAAKSGAVSPTERALISDVTGYSSKEAKRVDEKRATAGVNTRRQNQYSARPSKKAESVSLSDAQAERLKSDHPDTPQGRRDRLMMCILLDHGLRVGELALITVGNINLKAGTVTFYRPKVDKTDTQKLSPDTRKALKAWDKHGHMPLSPDEPILRSSLKSKDGDKLGAAGMTENAISKRVRSLGAKHGIAGLSAHDCRHYWATYWAARIEKLPRGLFTLQEWGGWNSLAMPRHYVERAKISNDGVFGDNLLGED